MRFPVERAFLESERRSHRLDSGACRCLLAQLELTHEKPETIRGGWPLLAVASVV